MHIETLNITLLQPEAPTAAHIGLEQVLQSLQRVAEGGAALHTAVDRKSVV